MTHRDLWRLHIDGESVESRSGETFDSVNPADGTLFARVSRGDAADIARAVSAARSAFEGEWGRVGPEDRQRLILRLAEIVDRRSDELAELDSREMGGPIARVRGMVKASAAFLEWYASLARHIRGRTIENRRSNEVLSFTYRDPVGVVGALTPWNTPVPITTWKLGPVLATGCTIVHKPAEETSLSALLLAEMCLEAGIPPGVVNVVTGGRDAGAALASHDGVDKIAFTGSIETGKRIVEASAGNIKRLSLELGGKSPNIVFADADLEVAAESAARAIFANSGQVCVAPSRLYVERGIYEDFVERVTRIAASLVVGDPMSPTTDLGPLASRAQLDRVTGYVAKGLDEGARLVAGGRRLTGGSMGAGFYFEPTVFADVSDEMAISREEIFGPVLSASAFDDAQDVVERCNRSPFGLAAYVWTRDVGRAHRMAKDLRTGTISVNSVGNLDPAVPIGGYRMSGYGRELGVDQLDDYLETKSVWIRLDN